MNSEFPRIITEERKKRGLSQKQAAADLGVSQALLSHYEKGIRECGLDFVVKAADYYGVSCDKLLGHSESSCTTNEKADDENAPGRAADFLMSACDEKLTEEMRSCMMMYFYKLFRLLCSDEKTFCVPKAPAENLADSVIMSTFASIKMKCGGKPKLSPDENFKKLIEECEKKLSGKSDALY